MMSRRFSLLEPSGSIGTNGRYARMSADTIRDLGYDRVIDAMVFDSHYEAYIRDMATRFVADPGVIEYRLDVLEDLLGNEALETSMRELLPLFTRLEYYVNHPGKLESTPLQEAVWRLRELETYLICVETLSGALSRGGLRSTGLRELARVLTEVREDPAYRELAAAMPRLLSLISGIGSITVGINLNDGLVPVEAVLLSVNEESFGGTAFLEKMTRRRGDSAGIGRLHSSKNSEYRGNPLMIPLFKDLSMVMEKAVKPLAEALKNFTNISASMMVHLRDDFLFYLGAASLMKTLESRGFPVCRPRILDADSRVTRLIGMYNPDLALQTSPGGSIVPNDLTLDGGGRIWLLTGPNRGGKTTYIQAVGLCQLLAQIGLYVPAVEAEIGVCDRVLTHFPALEDPLKGTGRFGEEAQRLRSLFDSASEKSIILLNETFSSTSYGEALYLAQDLLRVMRTIGTRGIFATHIHQLAADVDELNADTGGTSIVAGLVAGVEIAPDGDIRPNFVVLPGPPTGKSYAADLAFHYGISREQLLAGRAVGAGSA